MEEADENVVFQGSDLHNHLSKFGYTHFETVPINRKNISQPLLNNFQMKCPGMIKHFYSQLSSMCHEFTKGNVNNQLHIILQAKALLDDHAEMIAGFIEKTPTKCSKTYEESFLISTILDCKYFSKIIFVSMTVYLAARLIHKCLNGNGKLQNFVLLQNDLHDLCKNQLKILKYGYKLNHSRARNIQSLDNVFTNRLKYLQPIMENLITFMEEISLIYYKACSSFVKILPSEMLRIYELTKFEDDAFKMKGEINYRSLQQLYHKYILVQSEMMYLLAIVNTMELIPSATLHYIIGILIKSLTKHKSKLLKNTTDYNSCKFKPIHHKYSGLPRSKWQDLCIYLDSTSYRLQLAYHSIMTILTNINGNFVNEKNIEEAMYTINEVNEHIKTAKDFAEFSHLLIMKIRSSNSTNNENEMENPRPLNETCAKVVIIDSAPEILDEVFEEYIKDEYLNSLHMDTDVSAHHEYKLNKSLSENLMRELKDVLIDRRKFMSERESQALERIYKNLKKEIQPDIVEPMTLPSSHDDEEFINSKPSSQDHQKITNKFKENDMISTPLSQIGLNPMQLPPVFFQKNEDTFTGSGENLNEEFI